jgi:DNA polymerase elongation subunit (family B)
MKRIVFDIETIGHDFDSFDATTQASLTRWIARESEGDEALYNLKLEEVKNGLGLSSLTGEIVAIGILDVDTNKGAVYYQDKDASAPESEQDGIKFGPMSEEAMLNRFWTLATQCDEFISFNGRGFDAPWLNMRSAKYKIKPTRDLMEGRFLYQQKNCRHVDLQEQLSYYGAVQRKGNLHLWCRLFDIKSPKAEGVNGDEVTQMFNDGKCLEIARYNVADLRATRELFSYWNSYLRFN